MRGGTGARLRWATILTLARQGRMGTGPEGEINVRRAGRNENREAGRPGRAERAMSGPREAGEAAGGGKRRQKRAAAGGEGKAPGRPGSWRIGSQGRGRKGRRGEAQAARGCRQQDGSNGVKPATCPVAAVGRRGGVGGGDRGVIVCGMVAVSQGWSRCGEVW